MISLKDKRIALMNLAITIRALEDIDTLLDKYDDDKPGPAYAQIDSFSKRVEVQFDRKILVQALQDQKQHFVEYLATLGIDANN